MSERIVWMRVRVEGWMLDPKTGKSKKVTMCDLRAKHGGELTISGEYKRNIEPYVPELHEMAARIGMTRAWFQGDHYDLTPSRRELAVKHGAREAGRFECFRIICALR